MNGLCKKRYIEKWLLFGEPYVYAVIVFANIRDFFLRKPLLGQGRLAIDFMSGFRSSMFARIRSLPSFYGILYVKLTGVSFVCELSNVKNTCVKQSLISLCSKLNIHISLFIRISSTFYVGYNVEGRNFWLQLCFYYFGTGNMYYRSWEFAIFFFKKNQWTIFFIYTTSLKKVVSLFLIMSIVNLPKFFSVSKMLN